MKWNRVKSKERPASSISNRNTGTVVVSSVDNSSRYARIPRKTSSSALARAKRSSGSFNLAHQANHNSFCLTEESFGKCAQHSKI